jgi:hypothetical protein
MTYRLAICLVIASLALAAPRPVSADANIQAVYDTVDSVEIKNHDTSGTTNCGVSGFCTHALVVVTGIRAGESTPSTQTFNFGINADMATRCERLAMIAMSKPGKYQFGIGSDALNGAAANGHGDCKLILVTP